MAYSLTRTYLNKLTYLNTFKIEVAHRCWNNGDSTLLLGRTLVSPTIGGQQ